MLAMEVVVLLLVEYWAMELLGDMAEDMVQEELDMEVVVVKEEVLDMELVVNMEQDMVVEESMEVTVVAMVPEESMGLTMEGEFVVGVVAAVVQAMMLVEHMLLVMAIEALAAVRKVVLVLIMVQDMVLKLNTAAVMVVVLVVIIVAAMVPKGNMEQDMEEVVGVAKVAGMVAISLENTTIYMTLPLNKTFSFFSFFERALNETSCP